MTDVGKVSGDKNRPEPKGPRRKKDVDSEAFREMMKVGKVREPDPEEKRERKRQAEAEEDLKEQQPTSLPHQGLGDQEVRGSVFDPSEGKGPTMEGSSAGAQGPDFYPSYEPPPYEPQLLQQPQPADDHQKKKKKVEENAPLQVPEKKKKVGKTPSPPPPTGKVEEKREKAISPSLPARFPKEKKAKVEEKKPISPEEMVAPPPKALPPLPSGAWEASQDKSKGEKKEAHPLLTPEDLAPLQPPPTPSQAPSTPFPSVAPLTAPFAHLPAPIQQLFERMVGVMSVMNTSGVQQTTIHLDNPQFAKSIFYGAQIIITEYSTAPKAYNIELRGSGQAVTLMRDNAEELVAAFQAGNYTFKVNRIDTGYIAPREVRRKETSRVKRKKSGG